MHVRLFFRLGFSCIVNSHSQWSGFKPAQKASFPYWCENVFLAPPEPTCVWSPPERLIAPLWLCFRLIRCLKTYLLFWWSEEGIADVSLKDTCGLSLSSIYKRTRAALKSIYWMRGWETLLYSILYHSSYITQTATELKHSEGAIFIQLCLLHWGRLDVSAFKSLCELFHSELGPFHRERDAAELT